MEGKSGFGIIPHTCKHTKCSFVPPPPFHTLNLVVITYKQEEILCPLNGLNPSIWYTHAELVFRYIYSCAEPS